MPIHISSLQHRLQSRPSREGDDMHLSERRWFAIRTKSKHEKKAARGLEIANIEYYLPLRQKVSRYKGRKDVTTTEIPLLSGYLFVFVHQKEELKVLQTDYVSSFVKLGRQRIRVWDEELDLLRKISTDRDLSWDTIEDAFAFTEGTPVEIIKGPLTGIRGYFLNKKNKKTFLISLSGVNACLATCEVDPAYLAPLTGAEKLSDSPPGGRERKPS